MREGIYETRITHARHKPVEQSFTVLGYMLYVDVSRFDSPSSHVRLLAFSGFAWHCFRRRDFSLIADLNRSAVVCVQDYLKKHSRINADRVFLLAHPAIAGYNFNPVSFFFCFARGRHVATIVEVNNTFGEQKHFILSPPHRVQQSRKNFYVSPFISPFAHFSMAVNAPADELDIRINTIADEPQLLAHMSGRRYPLERKQLIKFAFKYPFYTHKVITLIHYYALRLYLKKVPYFPKKNSDAAIIHAELRSAK